MAQPVGVTVCTVTCGSAFNFFGDNASIEVSVTPMLGESANTIVWESTGQPLSDWTATYTATEGTPATFVVPHVDQVGFVDGSLSAVTNWYYEAQITEKLGRSRKHRTKKFQVFVGQTNIDLDLVPDGTIVEQVNAPFIGIVKSVNGEVGDVVVNGVPDGGTTGEVLRKLSDDDGDYDWQTPASAPVTSVNGEVGAVDLSAADVGAATDAQGALADTAVQPGDLSTVATTGAYADLSGKPTLGTAAAAATTDFASAAQGATADNAVQPGDLATVATSGSYDDLSDQPTIPAQVNLIEGANIDISGAYPNLTIAATDAQGVTSVNGDSGPAVTLDTDDVSAGTTNKYVTAADITKLGNLSGTNTGDQDLSGLVPNTRTVNGHALSANVTVSKSDVSLGNVDNTADTAKPVSTAQQTALNLKADLASPTFTGTVSGISKSMVGLGNVDNTADASKPVSTAQAAADTAATAAAVATSLQKASNLSDLANAGTARTNLGLGTAATTAATAYATAAQGATADTAVQPARTVNGHALSADVTVTKGDVGLGNVDNTSDANKPVSTATQTALDLKANASAITQFLTAQTDTAYTPPAGYTGLLIRVQGSGGGSGSGRRGAVGTLRTGGASGGCGARSEQYVSAASLAAAGVTALRVSVGAAGTGGAAVTVDDTNGNPGTAGGASYVLTGTSGAAAAANTLVYAGGGTAGNGGNGTGAATQGNSQTQGMFAGPSGSGSQAAGGSGGTGNAGMAGSGGAGGGLSTADVVGTGGSGATSITGFATTTGHGSNGISQAVTLGGYGGGGGNASKTAAAEAGGTGGRGASGGGGGASLNGFNSGAGGAGGVGFVEIVAYF